MRQITHRFFYGLTRPASSQDPHITAAPVVDYAAEKS
jgi:hypothetical protein